MKDVDEAELVHIAQPVPMLHKQFPKQLQTFQCNKSPVYYCNDGEGQVIILIYWDPCYPPLPCGVVPLRRRRSHIHASTRFLNLSGSPGTAARTSRWTPE